MNSAIQVFSALACVLLISLAPTAGAGTCNIAEAAVFSDLQNPLGIDGWEEPFFMDALASGVKGTLIAEDRSDLNRPTEVYLEIHELPDHVTPSSRWIFLRQQETLDALKNRFLNQGRPILLQIPRVNIQKQTFLGGVDFKRSTEEYGYWPCLKQDKTSSLLVTPGTDYWILLHEERHYTDVEIGFVNALDRTLYETLYGKFSDDYFNLAISISGFILEQRAYETTRRAQVSGVGPTKHFHYQLQFSNNDNISPFADGVISPSTFDYTIVSQRRLAEYALEILGNNLNDTLDLIKEADLNTYERVLTIIQSNISNSNEYTLNRFVSDHFQDSQSN